MLTGLKNAMRVSDGHQLPHPSLFILLASALLLGIVTEADGFQLPDESRLPGQPLARVSPAPRPLPDEGQLPGVQPGRREPATEESPESPGGDRPPETSDDPPPRGIRIPQPETSQLPTEAELPGSAGGSDPTPERGDPADTQELDKQPWLRLNLPGHSARIRNMTFSPSGERLFSAGEDKVLQFWKRESNRWNFDRTGRWRIQRANRGWIFAVATSDRWVAIGGIGAQGLVGEIALFDHAAQLQTMLVADGNLGAVTDLQFAPGDSATLVSADIHGRVLLWRRAPDTGRWNATELVAEDERAYPQHHQALRGYRSFSPITFAGPARVVVPVLAQPPRENRVPVWHLKVMDLVTSESFSLKRNHLAAVTQLSASADGRWLVSTDMRSQDNLTLFDLRARTGQSVSTQRPVISLDMSADGKRVVLGTQAVQGGAALQLWQPDSQGRLQFRKQETVGSSVFACCIDNDGGTIAYAQENELRFVRGDTLEPLKSSRPPVSAITSVAFSKAASGYSLALARGGSPSWQATFDTQLLQLNSQAVPDADDWLANSGTRFGEWTLAESQFDGNRRTYSVSRSGRLVGSFELQSVFHGQVSAVSWIETEQGPAYVAVGTNRRNDIYVYDLAAVDGKLPLVRHFRGHTGAVRSLGTSADRRYLASGGDDATLRVWPLGILQLPPTVQRWGAQFEVQNGKLVVREVRKDGPLYFRGIRSGDQITQIQWNGQVNVTDPVRVRQELAQSPWDRLTAFFYQRDGQPQEPFQVYPAFQPVVSLLLTDTQQWAYWSPTGYYDASFQGHKLFGWQVNHGLNDMPDFFLADQLRKELERPQVMSRLLEAGNIDDAFLLAKQAARFQSHKTLTQQYALKPRVVITTPEPGVLANNESLRIEARVSIRNDQQLISPKAFANGVVCSHRKLVDVERGPNVMTLTYQWETRLPRDSRIRIQVFAATDSEVVGLSQVEIRQALLPTHRSPRFHLVAAGVNQYRDAQITDLNYAVKNATTIADVLANNMRDIYTPTVTLLRDQQLSRGMWQLTLEQVSQSLQDHSDPNDVLMIFLSGHGLQDARTGRYYFVTPQASFADLMAGRYQDCLAFEDLARLAELPCRKVVVLDTCHSGAIQQPLQQQHLKSALRALQSDVVVTLTASEGHQEAAEVRELGLSRFANRLSRGLSGEADQVGNQDQVVTLRELVAYVQETVAADAMASQVRQHPTAGPSDLLENIELPLTRVSAR